MNKLQTLAQYHATANMCKKGNKKQESGKNNIITITDWWWCRRIGSRNPRREERDGNTTKRGSRKWGKGSKKHRGDANPTKKSHHTNLAWKWTPHLESSLWNHSLQRLLIQPLHFSKFKKNEKRASNQLPTAKSHELWFTFALSLPFYALNQNYHQHLWLQKKCLKK